MDTKPVKLSPIAVEPAMTTRNEQDPLGHRPHRDNKKMLAASWKRNEAGYRFLAER